MSRKDNVFFLKKCVCVYIYIYIYIWYPASRTYRLCPLKSAALSLICVRVPWLLRLWESKPLFTLLAPEASKILDLLDVSQLRVHYGLCSRGSSKLMEIVGNVW